MLRYLVPLLFLMTILAAGAYLLRSSGEPAIEVSLAVSEAMGGDTTGYARAKTVRPIVFPDDYGPHPGYKTEWWYYTGNLNAEDGKHFGYQFTLFRIALTSPAQMTEDRASGWAASQLFMAHFALSDAEAEQFYAYERFSRGAAGLAGAQAAPYRVWLEDWSVQGGPDGFPMQLHAAQDRVVLDLTLQAVKPVVLQGDRGLDQKGPELGNASYYYSFTRLLTEGTVTIDGRAYAVQGLSWKDHEWSTSALGEEQVGWDWFSLQLSNGQDVMYYQLRQRDGTPSPFTNGILVRADGTTRSLAPDEVFLDVGDTWTSPRGGRYPAAWRFRVPDENLDLTITPYMASQELDVSVRYWEGAVRIAGTAGGGAVTGSGFVELTGYAETGQAGGTANDKAPTRTR